MNGSTQHIHDIIEFGEFRLCVSARLLERNQETVPIGSRAFDLLVMLAANAGNVVSKDQLIACAWPNLIVEESNLRFQISQLRRVLETDKADMRFVQNIPGRGYSFVHDVRYPAANLAPTSAPQQTDLPSALKSMIGRAKAQQAISTHLLGRRLVTIVGHGGIGKTTIATSVGHHLSGQFNSDVCFVDLGGITDPAVIPGTIAEALGVTTQLSQPLEGLIKALQSRRMLMILDCCEHVVDAITELTEALLPAAPDLHILATSREPLRAEAEQVFDLLPLEIPPEDQAVKVADIFDCASVALFIDRARATGFSGEFTAQDAISLARICQKLGGIPLAIELAAARCATHGLSALERLLDGQLQLLWRGRRTAIPRQKTLMATLDWSHALLSVKEQTVLRRLSVLVGGFSAEAAAAIASDSSLSGSEVIAALERLVAKSMVFSDPGQSRHRRFRLLDITRAYAFEKLSQSDDLDAARLQHAEYQLAWLTEIYAQKDLHQKERKQILRHQVANLRAALTYVFANPDHGPLARTLARRSARMFIELSYLQEGRHWSQQALESLPKSARGGQEEIELQSALGHTLMYTLGNSEAAQTAMERSLSLAENADLPEEQFRTLITLHTLHRRNGQFQQLAPLAARAETAAAQLSDPYVQSALHVLHGITHQLTGNMPLSIDHIHKSLSGPWQQQMAGPGHFAYVGNARLVQTLSLWLGGFADQAIEVADELIKTPEQPDAVMHCAGLSHALIVLEGVGDSRSRDTIADQLIDVAERNALEPYIVVGTGFRGLSMLQSGKIQEGLEVLERVIANLNAFRYALYAGHFLRGYAFALAHLGQNDMAIKAIETVLTSAYAQHSFEIPEFERALGRLHELAGNPDAAEAAYRRGYSVAEQQGTLAWKMRIANDLKQLSLGPAAVQIGDLHAACYAEFTEGFGTADLERARLLSPNLT